jgi:hypothetical protein
MIKVIKKVDQDYLRDFIYNIDLEDKNLYKVLEGSPLGIFQFSGGTAEGVTKQVKPENFKDIVAINGFARPGTIDFLPQYLENKRTGTSSYPEKVHSLLKDTHGTMIFQEQAMNVFNKIGGLSLEKTNNLRGLMKRLSKADKRPEDLKAWDEAIAEFEQGAKNNGLSSMDARKISNDMLMMSSYNFNLCFSGDCKIDRDNTSYWSPTIEEMYLTKNDKEWANKNGHKSLNEKYNYQGYGLAFSLHENDKLFPNFIKDIYYQGEREVFLIELENGKSIKVTNNHKFPAVKNTGEKVEISIESGLNVGDFLFSNEGYKKDFQERYNYRFSDIKTVERKFKKYEGQGFQKEEENSAFINGVFVEFEKGKEIALARANGACEKCGVPLERLEIHHIDFDRRNNSTSNLIALCPSCHKKEHYKNGRTRKNEKGKETALVKIVSIISKGLERTYDVEMEAPYHTLSVNGIVAKNSHAVAYSYNAVITMYLTYYFRKFFYSTIIEYAMDKDRDDVPNVLKKIREYGFSIYPPDINKSKEKTFVEDSSIYIGLKTVKQVGDEVATTIVSNAPYNNFFEFLIKNLENSKVNKRAIGSLVKFGAFDKLEAKLNRRQMIRSFEEFWDAKGSFSKSLRETISANKDVDSLIKENRAVGELYTLWERYKNQWQNETFIDVDMLFLKDMEKETLGFNFFVSPFNSKELSVFEEGEKRNLMKLSFSDLKNDNVSWRVPVFISKMRVIKDKNKNEMAFVDIQDTIGDMVSIPVFASFWEHLSDKIYEGAICLLTLYRNDKEQVMLGMNKFIRDENLILKFVSPIRRSYV